MKAGLEGLENQVRQKTRILTDTRVTTELLEQEKPDLLIWATGVKQNIRGIEGMGDQNSITSLDYFSGEKAVEGPRVLVIGAERTGLEIVEKLGRQGFDVTATKRHDPIVSGMDLLGKRLILARIEKMPNVLILLHTTVKVFYEKCAEVEKDGKLLILDPFLTIILASGMLPAAEPDQKLKSLAPRIEFIGDAWEVNDIFSATKDGYDLAKRY